MSLTAQQLATTSIRCSALPLAWACPESQNPQPGEALINESGEPAEAGTAFHRWMAAHIGGIELEQTALAAEHGCDPDELSMLCAMGCKALAELRKYFDNGDGHMMTEVAMRHRIGGTLEITGTADILGRQARTALVLDWKTGRLDADHTHQLRGYAFAAAHEVTDGRDLDLDLDDVLVITVLVRQGIWDIERVTIAQLRSWEDTFLTRMHNGRGNFNPGEHCRFCQRRAECPGRRALVRSAIADLSVEGVKVIEWTPETRAALGPSIGEAYGKVKLLESVAGDFRASLKADIQEHGPLSIGGGRRLGLVNANRREADTAKARPVLRGWLSDEEIDQATSISLSEAERLAMAKAPKGGKGKTKDAIAEALAEAGAVTVHEVQQLRETKEIP